MLSNASFLAKFRFDTAENEPAKNLQNFAKICPNFATFANPNSSGGTGRGVQRHLIKLARVLGCEEQRGEPAAPRGGDRAESAVRCDHAD